MKLNRLELRRLIESVINEEVHESKSVDEAINFAVDSALNLQLEDNSYFKQLMKNIAKTESGFNIKGLDDKLTHHYSNPFQIDEIAYRNIKTSSNMRKWRNVGNSSKTLKQNIESYSYSKIKENIDLNAVYAALNIIWSLGRMGNRSDSNNPWDPDNFNVVSFPEKAVVAIVNGEKVYKHVPIEGPEAEAFFHKYYYNTIAGDTELTYDQYQNIEKSDYLIKSKK